MRSLEIIVSLSLAFGVSALAAPVSPRSKLNTASPAHGKTAAKDCEGETDVPRMLDVASPVATSSQDVSNPARSGDNADTVTSIASASSAPSNPSSDAVFNPAMADTLFNPLERSSLNSAQSNELDPSVTSTSSRLSQVVDNAQLASTNFGAMGQYGAFVGSDPQLTRTLNPASTLNVIQNGIFPAGILSGTGDLAPSIQAVSSQANLVNSLGSNLNIPQRGAANNIPLPGRLDSIESIGILSGNGNLAPSLQAISSQANVMNTLGSNLNIPQNSAVNDISLAFGSILPVGISSGNGDLAPSIQAVSSQANVVNTLESNLNIPQSGAVNNIPLPSLGPIGSILPAGILSGNANLAPSIQAVSSQANAVNTLGSNLNIPQNGVVNNIPLPSGLNPIGSTLPAGILLGNGDLVPSIPAVSFGPILPVGISSGNGNLAASNVVNSLGSNLNIPQNAAVNDIPLPSGLDSILPLSGNGDLAPSIQAISSQGNVVNSLGSNLNILQNGAVNNIPLPSGLDGLGSIGTNIAGMIGPLRAASLEPGTISDPLRQSSFTNNFPDSLNPLPRISNGVETSTSSDQIITGPKTTTNGNCICDSYE